MCLFGRSGLVALHFYGKRQWAVVWWSVMKGQERNLAGKCTIIQGLWSSWYVWFEKGHTDETRRGERDRAREESICL